jgi:hypothetical protein
MSKETENGSVKFGLRDQRNNKISPYLQFREIILQISKFLENQNWRQHVSHQDSSWKHSAQ